MNGIEDKDVLDAITERIFQFLEAKGLSSADFAATIDIGAAVVSHMKNGRNKVSLNVYAKIIDSFPDLNPDWLLLGEGSMYRNGTASVKKENSTEPTLFTNNSIEEKTRQTFTEDMKITQSNENTVIPHNEKAVKKIVIFYDDNTFQEFMP